MKIVGRSDDEVLLDDLQLVQGQGVLGKGREFKGQHNQESEVPI